MLDINEALENKDAEGRLRPLTEAPKYQVGDEVKITIIHNPTGEEYHTKSVIESMDGEVPDIDTEPIGYLISTKQLEPEDVLIVIEPPQGL